MANSDYSDDSKSPLITIQPVGLGENEVRMIKSLCTISSIAKGSRNRKYALAAPGETGDIYLVDAGKADAYTRWRIANHMENIPALLIADVGYEHDGSNKVAHRPLIPSRLLSMLDNLPVCAIF